MKCATVQSTHESPSKFDVSDDDDFGVASKMHSRRARSRWRTQLLAGAGRFHKEPPHSDDTTRRRKAPIDARDCFVMISSSLVCPALEYSTTGSLRIAASPFQTSNKNPSAGSERLLMQACRSTLPRRLSHNLKRAAIRPINPTHTRTMAFFPRNFYNPDASFAPLFRLLDEFDAYSRPTNGTGAQRRSALPIWQPKFDVRETRERYELHGELPGVSKEQVQIEFTEPQTMVVRGRVERSYTTGAAPGGLLGDAPATKAIAEGGDEQASASRHATVEDDGESAKSPSTEVTNQKTEAPSKEPADAAKYWLSERSVGEFSRTFSFPGSIDQDSVTASFKDGILSIAVPKAKRQGSRHVTIN
ncbi:hypothetical protein PCL_06904 [Purpureocillium lilacinum]|uniref:SHSP domain-containing protein n=1 Tax=Purpureocillium lilacinum TaxID=33203 RepID=A0A2U3DTX5_PURLI|nr:hypothetical protein PCL_06904 [Purpureocillium lilacinum]